MAKNKLLDFIDFKQVSLLLDGFNKTTGFVTAILDLDGNILCQSGWRNICVRFHRTNKETAHKCEISDTRIANKLASGEEYHSYQCLNGLIDVAVPLKIQGIHIANIFTGQFFYEKPNMEFFINQAQTYDFDEKAYIKSLEQVPIVNKKQVRNVMDFLLNMTKVISEMTKQRMEQLELSKELKKSEQRWQFAIEGNGDGLWDWNMQTNEVYFSEQWKNMLGYKSDEVPHKFDFWDKLVHPHDKKQAYKDIQRHIDGDKPEYLNEHRLLCKDGSYKWIRSKGKITNRDRFNKPIRFIGTHIDISDYKAAQDKLLEQQLFLTKAQSIGKIGTWELDLKKNTLKWTAQNYDTFGIPAGTPLNYETFINCVHPDDRIYVDTEWGAALKGKSYDIEHRIINNGEVKWVREKCDIEFDENNNAVSAIGFCQDITHRKTSEEAIKESEAVYRNLVEVMPDGVYKSTKDGKFVEVNQALVDMLGYLNKDDLMSIDIKTQLYFKVADRESVVLKEKQEQRGIYRMKKKDGSEIWVEDHGWLNYDEKTETLYHEGIMRDITQRKNHEEELLKLSTAIEQSPSIIAITDKKGLLEYVNPQFTKLTGYTLKEAKTIKTFIITSGHTKRQEKEIWDTINSGDIWRGDIHNQKKNGENYWESVTISPVFNESGNITNFLKLSEDVSNLSSVFNYLKFSC
ncbi:PAS domain S-box protein [Lentimicrobium sp. S6]|uniref:PAS domain S-box protein n=1 Tax=Lentimicrobium sp. S6 TaxID=2735872 RepID=UPI001555493D|nr:PAS domain S-box protein [Lentimicrobium sp. S6]NPD47545.1 PAS domain S-box protein [Lentimicrobium sp. S6]